MKSDVHTLEVVLRATQQWVVPVYQRHYKWGTGEDEQVPTMWENLTVQATDHMEKRVTLPHYFGAIMYADAPDNRLGKIRQCHLVDGQQRMTSFHLLIRAIKEVAQRHGHDEMCKFADLYLFNTSQNMENPERERFKVWPSHHDRDLYKAIVAKSWDDLRDLRSDCFTKKGLRKNGRVKIPTMLRAYGWFVSEIENFARKQNSEHGISIEDSCKHLLNTFLNGFQVVAIELGENDDAQEIFSTLNGRGEPLSPFDLIRNDIFHRASDRGADESELYAKYWSPFETEYWMKKSRQGRFTRTRADHFVAHAVMAEVGRVVNVGKIETEYRRVARAKNYDTVTRELEVLDMHAKCYASWDSATQIGAGSELQHLLKTWNWTTFHPFILAVNKVIVDEGARDPFYAYLESFIIRREICGLTSRGYNKVAVNFVNQLHYSKGDFHAFNLGVANASSDATRMPVDRDLREAFYQRNVYDKTPKARLKHILVKLEMALRKNSGIEGVVSAKGLSVEHIMPRKWAEHWPLPDGSRAICESSIDAMKQDPLLDLNVKAQMDARERVVNTMGNLTLLTSSLNASASNGPWEDKKKLIKKSTLLKMNQDIIKEEEWSEQSIERRARELAALACATWKVEPV